MSNHVAAIVQRRVVGSATKKTVLMYMAERASDDGTGIWTSKSHMSLDTELSKRSVQTAIKEFEEAGIIRQVGTRACKHGFTYEYSIDMEALKALPSTREKTGAGDSPVQDVHPKGCTTFTPTGAGDSPKPSLEPSLEPSFNAGNELPLFSENEQRQPKGKPSISIEEKFKEFYRVFPKKVAPDAAKRNFLRAVKAGADPDDIIAGAERYAKHVQAKGTERGYIKNPQGWLTDKRWEDDEPAPQPAERRRYQPREPFGEVFR